MIKADCVHGAEAGEVVLIGSIVAVPSHHVEGREALRGGGMKKEAARNGGLSEAGDTQQQQQQRWRDRTVRLKLAGCLFQRAARGASWFAHDSPRLLPPPHTHTPSSPPPHLCCSKQLPLELVHDREGSLNLLKPGCGVQEVPRVGQPVCTCNTHRGTHTQAQAQVSHRYTHIGMHTASAQPATQSC